MFNWKKKVENSGLGNIRVENDCRHAPRLIYISNFVRIGQILKVIYKYHGSWELLIYL